MEINKLGVWLAGLAAMCQCELKQNVIDGYLEILSDWNLSDTGWLELRRRAVLRNHYPRYLPSIADLHDITDELREETSFEPAGSEPRPPKGCEWKRDERGGLVHPLEAVPL